MALSDVIWKLKKATKDPYWAFERAYIRHRDLLKKFVPARYKPQFKKVEYSVYTKLNQLEQFSSLHLKKHNPIKKQGKNRFTIVAAIYYVDKYLDQFFDSIVHQSLDFKKHIQIICVDDGSPDNSAKIIKQWQKKYPNNIHYYYKENGGQASARNLGLEYVETEWVTFIDPDDLLSNDYFAVLDRYIEKDNSLAALVSNLVFYLEDKKVLRDGHPLRYRFDNNPKYSIKDLKNAINLSASSTLFQTAVIRNHHLSFDDRIKPNFEDGKFIADYFLVSPSNNKIQFIKESKYFYRKREDSSSTLDGSWQKEEKFYNVLKFGFLPMLEEYAQQNNGNVPYHIQRTALYDMAWYVVYLLNSPEKTAFLSKEQKQTFQDLLEEIFIYIDQNTILNFNLAGLWWFQKVGMLGLFKKEQPEKQIVYIENIDREKKQILLSYYTSFDCVDSVKIGGQDVTPVYSKTVVNKFNERIFAYEKRYWVSYENVNYDDFLEITIDGQPSRVSLKNKNHMRYSVKGILDAFMPSNKYRSDGSWLLMDRETQADDNAEHFYRYIQQHYPNQKCYFVLNKTSDDWARLENEGFELVEFGSSEYEKRLRKASKIISSHIESHINNYFGDNYEFSKKFVFLQHGVIKDDLSRWLNTKKILNMFVTTTYPEYESIANNSNYKWGKKSVSLTGLPRHDILLLDKDKDKDKDKKKTILIMPTWRNNIVGESFGTGANTRVINDDFMETDYAKAWFGFIHNDYLKVLSKEVEIIFAPHPNIAPYITDFKMPNYIKVWDSSASMQELFKKASLLVTDYSSVAFEVAYINKPVLYYQFDADKIFSGSHTYQKGYFSYEKDAFGPIAYNEESAFSELKKMAENDFKLVEPYKSRIENTFPFRDGKNCERVYQAILDLDKPETKTVDVDTLIQRIQQAYDYQAWDLLENRLELLAEQDNITTDLPIEQMTLEALFGLNKFSELEAILAESTLTEKQKTHWLAQIAYAENKWQQAVGYWEKSVNLSLDEHLKLLKSYAMLADVKSTENLVEKLRKELVSENESRVVEWLCAMAHQDWHSIIEKQELLERFSEEERAKYQIELIFARAFRKLERYNECHQQLVRFEQHSKNVISCRLEIVSLAFDQKNYQKVVKQIESAFKFDISAMSNSVVDKYIQAVDKTKKNIELHKLMNETSEREQSSFAFKALAIKDAVNTKNWQFVIDQSAMLNSSEKEILIDEISKSYFKLGKFDELKTIYQKPTSEHKYNYWQLIADFALVIEDRELEIYCYKGMFSIFDECQEKNRIYLSGLLKE